MRRAPDISASQQLESVVRALPLIDGEVDPEHCQRLEQTRVREWADIDRIQPGLFDQLFDYGLGGRIVAAVETVSLLRSKPSVAEVGRADGVERLHHFRSRGPDGHLFCGGS